MKRLIEIQSALKAPKDQKNTFGGYNYRSCEGILEAVKPLLKKHGLALIINDEVISIDGGFSITENTKDEKYNKETSKHLITDNRVYIKATATLFDEECKQIAQSTALAREEETKKGMDYSQLTGATSSYARKYALNGLFAIDDTKDSDATNTHGKEEKPKLPPKKEKKQVSDKDLEFYDIISAIDNAEDLKEYYKNTCEQVDDRESYHQLVVDRQKAIKEGK